MGRMESVSAHGEVHCSEAVAYLAVSSKSNPVGSGRGLLRSIIKKPIDKVKKPHFKYR